MDAITDFSLPLIHHKICNIEVSREQVCGILHCPVVRNADNIRNFYLYTVAIMLANWYSSHVFTVQRKFE